jgi:uncharacterized protein YyaL (SSP411 family)
LSAFPCYAEAPASPRQSIVWTDWSDAAFTKARKENKPIILDLEAVWCHWCHVMDKDTYANPAVVKLINEHFVALRVDQDSRPDLSNRYQRYGWPATIIFASGGFELVKRAGYIPPTEMANLLSNILKHPNQPEQSAITKPVAAAFKASLSDALKLKLQQQCFTAYDTANGGWGTEHKFADWDTLELCLMRAGGGDSKCAQMAQETLKAEMNLIDPIWGGVYQYSTHGDWKHPHFEKIMQMQAEEMRIFALAYQLWHNPDYLKAAKDIQRFLLTFLTSPSGAFYTSMDADIVAGKSSDDYFKLSDADRRKLGIPKIDTHLYTSENGWAINGLVALYQATSDHTYLDQAVRAANWVIANRALPEGGFRHDAVDKAGPYLDDSLAMGRAFLALYATTGDRQWLTRSEEAASFIAEHFKIATVKGSGYATTDVNKPGLLTPEALIDDNVMLCRWSNLLYYYTGNTNYRQMAEHAMCYLATPTVAKRCGFYSACILLADDELAKAPLHLTVVGKKDDPKAQVLFQAVLKTPVVYKRVDFCDPREKPLPNTDVEYPQLNRPAVFVCTNQRCSRPAYTAEELEQLAKQDN